MISDVTSRVYSYRVCDNNSLVSRALGLPGFECPLIIYTRNELSASSVLTDKITNVPCLPLGLFTDTRLISLKLMEGRSTVLSEDFTKNSYPRVKQSSRSVLTARKPTHAQKQYFAFVQPRGQTILLLPQMIFVPCRTTSQGQIQRSILSTPLKRPPKLSWPV